MTLVEGNLALDYGPSPIFDAGHQVVYGNLAIGAHVSPNTGGIAQLVFGEPPADFGTGYGGYNMGAGIIQYEQWSGTSHGRFMINRGIKITPASDYIAGPTLHLMGAPYSSNSAAMLLLGNNFLNSANAGGTFMGANASGSYAGDFLNFQFDGASKFRVDRDGKIYGDGSNLTGINSAVTLKADGGLDRDADGLFVNFDDTTIGVNLVTHKLALKPSYLSGAAYDARFVNVVTGDTMTGALTVTMPEASQTAVSTNAKIVANNVTGTTLSDGAVTITGGNISGVSDISASTASVLTTLEVGGGYGDTTEGQVGGLSIDNLGNLQLDGSIYYGGKIYQENVQQLLIADNMIILNDNDAGSARDAYITVSYTHLTLPTKRIV